MKPGLDKEQAYLKFADEVTQAVSIEHGMDAEAFYHYLQFAKKVWQAQATASAPKAVEPEAVTAVLAEALRKDIEDGIPEPVRDLVYGDLIRATLAHIDWPSLAECLLRRVAAESPFPERLERESVMVTWFKRILTKVLDRAHQMHRGDFVYSSTGEPEHVLTCDAGRISIVDEGPSSQLGSAEAARYELLDPDRRVRQGSLRNLIFSRQHSFFRGALRMARNTAVWLDRVAEVYTRASTLLSALRTQVE